MVGRVDMGLGLDGGDGVLRFRIMVRVRVMCKQCIVSKGVPIIVR